MRKVSFTQVDFSEIFYYAEEKFDIGWNACNDLFFNKSLTYKSYDEFEGGCEEYYDPSIPFEQLNDRDKGYFIINQFMKENNIEKLLVKNT